MIAIIDYQAGNIGSVVNALDRIGADFTVTDDPKTIDASEGVIFPGQGRAGPAMDSLKKAGLDKVLPNIKQPFLGICLGMQLMVENLEEDNRRGLGIIPGGCRHIQDITPVPHMGWDTLILKKKSQLLENIDSGDYVYFAHSYAVKTEEQFVLASTDYGGEFACVIAKDNFYGIQFHPEKSGALGEQILKNFLNICAERRGA